MAGVNTLKSLESRPIRWGIIGTGDIARKFAHALTFVPDAELAAVGSRAAKTAAAFASEFNIPDVHASYAALANDPAVDVVYIATPHKLHYENCMQCLNAGKAVLCEKSLTMNAAQAEGVIRTARENRLFLMEAMWTRYIPLIVRLRQLLVEGAIGSVQLFTGALGFTDPLPPTHYMFNLDLGGGILLDAGIYPVSMASMVFGRQPARIATLAEFDKGVDVQDVIDFGYDGGQQAAIAISLKTVIPPEFSVYGDAGRVRVHPPLWNPTRMTLSRTGHEDELIEIPFVGTGWNYQAVEVGRCLREGKLESAIMPLDESLAIMQTMDKIRAQWGFKYPFE